MDKYCFEELLSYKESKLLVRWIKEIPRELRTRHFSNVNKLIDKTHTSIEYAINKFKSENKEIVVNELFLLNQYIKVWESITNWWIHCCKKEYSISWNFLQDAIDCLDILSKHLCNPEDLKISVILNQLKCVEKAYPYQFFISPHFTAKRKYCSICNRDTLDPGCTHISGHIYLGEIADVKYVNEDLSEGSIVSSPNDKRNIISKVNGIDVDFKTIDELISRMNCPLQKIESVKNNYECYDLGHLDYIINDSMMIKVKTNIEEADQLIVTNDIIDYALLL